MFSRSHNNTCKLLRSHLSCVSVHVEIITFFVETIHFLYLSACLCYKNAAYVSSVWKNPPAQGSVFHSEQKVDKFGAFLPFFLLTARAELLLANRSVHNSFLWPGWVQFIAGCNSFGLLLCGFLCCRCFLPIVLLWVNIFYSEFVAPDR